MYQLELSESFMPAQTDDTVREITVGMDSLQIGRHVGTPLKGPTMRP